jgi:hypothetical protein
MTQNSGVFCVKMAKWQNIKFTHLIGTWSEMIVHRTNKQKLSKFFFLTYAMCNVCTGYCVHDGTIGY